MNFIKINYSDLNSKQKEIYNFQKIASELAEYGYNCIKLADDWQGADFLAYHKDGFNTLKVQLKSRLTINKNYLNKELYMAFPSNNSWYLISHDLLIEHIAVHTGWLNTESWGGKGFYHSANPSVTLLNSIEEYKL